MPELLVPVASKDAWSQWLSEHPDVLSFRSRVVADVRDRGVIQPLSGVWHPPAEVQIDEARLSETISLHGTNSRKRAVLLVLAAAAHARGWLGSPGAKVYVPEALTRAGSIVASVFEGPAGAPPASNNPRLETLGLQDASADAVVILDAFLTVESPAAAWAELRRVVRPGGLVISSVKFASDRSADAPFMEPGGLCGWSVIAGLKDYGFSDAAMVAVASSQYGIAADLRPGVMILVAKRDGGGAGGPLVPEVISQGALPEKLCLLVGLPRSGTTLTTAMFDVHSRFDSVYEPWNGKLLLGPEDARIETVLKRAKLPHQPGRFLFVKETAAQHAYVDHMRRLFEATVIPADRCVLMLCRKPMHTFMSEIERRKGWWGDDVELSQEQFDQWCRKTRQTLRALLELLRRSRGSLVCYERLAEDPASMLARLEEVVGFEAEPAQLEFEKHLDQRKVRGDLNVSKNPEPISTESQTRRAEGEAVIQEMVGNSPEREWFLRFSELHDAVYQRWTCRISDLPPDLLAALRGQRG